MLEVLITSKARLKIIKFFFSNTTKKCHLREVARLLELNPNQARIELERLSKINLLKKEKVANSNFYSLNRHFPSYKELRDMVRRENDIEDLIRKALENVAKIRVSFIFGSYASGSDHTKSDIDLMIIGEPNPDEVNKNILRIEKILRREIQYVVYPLKEFQEKKSYGFLRNVMKSRKIVLLGDIDELG